MTQSLVTDEASSTGSKLLVIVTGVSFCQGRRVETVLGTGPVPGAEIRQPGQTLSACSALPKHTF